MCMQFGQKYVLRDGVNKELLNILFPNNQIEQYGIILINMEEKTYRDSDNLEHRNIIQNYVFTYTVANNKTMVGALIHDGFNYFFQEATE